MRAEIDEVRRQLAQVPPEVVVANHAMGLYELAAIHLSQDPPSAPAAALAIDAMGALVDGLAGPPRRRRTHASRCAVAAAAGLRAGHRLATAEHAPSRSGSPRPPPSIAVRARPRGPAPVGRWE